MKLTEMALSTVRNTVNPAHALAGTPYGPDVPFHPPRGRYTSVHYGLMFANLPAPLNFLNIITAIGQPAIKIWRNDHLIETTAADTANVLIGSGVTFPGQFKGYQVARDLELAPDGSLVRFGDDLVIEGTYPDFTVTYRNPEFNLDLRVRATDKIAHFAKMIGGLYDHWALLCEHEGTVTTGDSTIELAGLNTLEYARGLNLPLPFNYFTYQILNINETTQILMAEILGPGGLPMHGAVYVRSLDDHGGVYEKGFRHQITQLEPEARITPNGLKMQLAKDFSWRVNDENGNELIQIHGITNGDFVYGMAGGYAGSYQYTGRFRGEEITGTAYIEHCGNR